MRHPHRRPLWLCICTTLSVALLLGASAAAEACPRGVTCGPSIDVAAPAEPSVEVLGWESGPADRWWVVAETGTCTGLDLDALSIELGAEPGLGCEPAPAVSSVVVFDTTGSTAALRSAVPEGTGWQRFAMQVPPGPGELDAMVRAAQRYGAPAADRLMVFVVSTPPDAVDAAVLGPLNGVAPVLIVHPGARPAPRGGLTRSGVVAAPLTASMLEGVLQRGLILSEPDPGSCGGCQCYAGPEDREEPWTTALVMLWTVWFVAGWLTALCLWQRRR